MLATSCHINVDIQLWNARSKKPSNSNIYPLCILRHHNIVNCFAFPSSGQWIAANCVSAVWIWKRKGHVLYMDKWRDWECIDIVRGIIGTANCIAWRLSTLEFITGSKD
ncbi:hypothetical protein BGX29_011284 [Mortierella sp. GBA35]|nr:hypothetical protein BGX29_011284 [Mortierella sp. GBA35]